MGFFDRIGGSRVSFNPRLLALEGGGLTNNQRSAVRTVVAEVAVPTRRPLDAFEVPKAEPQAKTAAPRELAPIKESVGGHSAKALNIAATTVFGELGAATNAQSPREAKAIASTIINRYGKIVKAREQFARTQALMAPAMQLRDEAAKVSEEWGGHRSSNRRALGQRENLSGSALDLRFDAEQDKLQSKFEEARKAYAAAQIANNAASSELIAAQGALRPDRRNEARPTLDMIVEDSRQYEGLAKGQEYLSTYGGETEANKRSLARRWELAKSAVLTLAADPRQADAFLEMRANGAGVKGRQGMRPLGPDETRINGNDFSVKPIK